MSKTDNNKSETFGN